MEFLNDWKEFFKGFKTMFQEYSNKETHSKQKANMITFSRLIIAFIIPALTILLVNIPSTLTTILVFGTTILGTITDFIDGKVARKNNSVSTFGKHLDIISDKVFSIMISISLSIINPIFLINLISELIITTINIIYKIKNSFLKTDSIRIGKIKQWPLSITFSLGFLSLIISNLTSIINIAIIITTIFQILTLFGYININNKQIKVHHNVAKEDKTVIEKEINNAETKELTLKEQYINLRNVLNEIIKLQNNKEIIDKPKIKRK